MKRRDFLLSTIAAAGLAPRGTSAPPTPPLASAAIPAIDTHIHLYDPTRPPGVPWPPKTDPVLYRPFLPDAFQAVAAPHHVVGAVVVEASDWVEDNQWVLDLTPAHSALVGVIGNLKPGQPEFAPRLERFARHPLFRGVRLKAADLKRAAEPAVAADLARLADLGMTVDVLGGSGILPATAQLATQFSSLRVVIDHLPFRDWDKQPAAMRAALAPCAACANVYIKISDVVRTVNGVPITDPDHYRAGLDALCELFGPDRVVYASNWPVSNRVAPYGTVHQVVQQYFAARRRAEAEKFFWRNSLAAYRWQPRGAAAALVESAATRPRTPEAKN